MAALLEVRPEDGGLQRPGFKRPENLAMLKEIINNYPETHSALTAKLLVSCIYADPDDPRRNEDLGLAIARQIREDYPDTWQATIAKGAEGGVLFIQGRWRAAAQFMEGMLDEVGRWEQSGNEGYEQYKRVMRRGQSHDLRADMLDALVLAYCKTGKLDKAREACERLVAEFPDFPGIDNSKRDLVRLRQGINPYQLPPPMTKAEIAEEIRRVDEE
jgi:hypothetical protein